MYTPYLWMGMAVLSLALGFLIAYAVFLLLALLVVYPNPRERGEVVHELFDTIVALVLIELITATNGRIIDFLAGLTH